MHSFQFSVLEVIPQAETEKKSKKDLFLLKMGNGEVALKFCENHEICGHLRKLLSDACTTR